MAADDAGRHGRRRWFRKPGDEAVPGDPGTETETANSTVDVMTQPEDPVREHDEDSRPEADPAPASAPRARRAGTRSSCAGRELRVCR